MEKSIIELREGEKGVITKILSGSGRDFGRRMSIKQLENLGIRAGKEVKVASIHPFGPIVIEIEGHRTAIGRGRAARIYVKV